LGWLIDLKGIVIKIESDDKLPADIFWFICVENSVESQLDLVINPFEVVFFDRFWLESETVSE
jgi:hypothetical protein